MAKTRRKALPFLVDQMELAEQLLNDAELGQLYAAVRRYAMDGEQPNMQNKSPYWRATFNLMSRAQNKAQLLYNETCERNRAAAIRRWHPSSR